MSKPSFSRRIFLRGAGVAIALPALDAFAQAPPVRLITFFIPNGMPLANLLPRESGAGFTITPCLQPLAELRNDFTLLSGIDASVYNDGHNGHAVGCGAFATGTSCTSRGAGGPSVEQVAARRGGTATRFASLAVAAHVNRSSPLFSNFSWSGTDQPVPAEMDERRLFARLFGAGTAAPGVAPDARLELLARARKSVLDFVTADITRLQGRLGADDGRRLQAHLTGIRELEKQVTATPRACPAPSTAPDPGSGHTAKAKVLMDLVAMGLQCGLTNYVGFTYGGGADRGPPDAAVGLTGHHHEAVHAGDLATMTRFTTAQIAGLAHLLRRLQAVDEGGRSLLYNSIVYAGTELGNGTSHDLRNLPVILAGNAGGRLTPGKHLPFTNKPPVSRLLLRLLHLAGIDEASFGTEAGRAATTSPLSF